MCNVIKDIKTIAALCALALACAACSKADPDKAAAEELLSQINLDLDAGRYEQALALMDTIDQKYGSQVHVRKQVIGLRPKAIEQVSVQQIAKADSMIAAAQMAIIELEPLMRHVDGNGLEGYYVVDKAGKDFIHSTGFEPRVNDSNFMFYIVAQTTGKKIGLNQIGLNTSSESCQSQVIPAGSERATVIEGNELASFLPEEVDELGRWAAAHAEDIKGATLYGNTGHQQVKLSPAQAAAVGTAWRYADAKLRLRQASIIREKLDRRLQVARDQAAQYAQPAN